MMDENYQIRAKLWLYPGKGGWHFITLPKKEAAAIRFLMQDRRNAWGAVHVTAIIGKTTWKTSLFPDKKSGSYLLPIKADIRKRENIALDDIVRVILRLDT